MSHLTPDMNERSIEHVRAMIKKKNTNNPFYATNNSVSPVVTDYDHHPYTRWFRGVYYYPDPIIAEREAGWREQENSCYDLVTPVQSEPNPDHCWEAPCSTIFPCRPKYLHRYADKELLDVMINNDCIVQYR